jgi:hypothetical protein
MIILLNNLGWKLVSFCRESKQFSENLYLKRSEIKCQNEFFLLLRVETDIPVY